ncbi:Ig-like domain-containing protein [Shewanella sp. 0m-4]
MVTSAHRLSSAIHFFKNAKLYILALIISLAGCNKSDEVLLPDIGMPDTIYLASFAEEAVKGQTLTIDIAAYVTSKADWQLEAVTDPKGFTTIQTITDTKVTLKADYSGVTQLVYQVMSQGKSYQAEILLGIEEPVASNSKPTAELVSSSLLSDHTFSINLNDVLHDADGDELTIVDLTQSADRFTLSNLQLTYKPNGFVGSDLALYGVIDGKGGVTVGQVVMTVSDANPVAPNQLPIALDYQTSVVQGDPLVIDVSGLISDPDEDEIQLSDLKATSGRAVLLSRSLNTIEYDSTGFFGDDSFIYVISDNKGGYASGEISVHVEPLPTPLPLSLTPLVFDFTVDEIKTLAIDSGVTSGLDWAISSIANDSGLVSLGAVTQNTVTIEAISAGVAVLDYVVETETEVQTSQLFLAITERDNTPPIASNFAKTTDSETPFSVDLAELVSDAETDRLTILPDIYQLANRFTLEGTKLIYSPAGFVGVESATYIVSDEQGGFAVGLVVVNSLDANPELPNNPPTAMDLNFSTDSKTPITLDLTHAVADADDDELSISVYASNGRALVDGLSISYTADGFWGVDEVVYVVNDRNGGFALGTIVFTVSDARPVNNVPFANSHTVQFSLKEVLAQPERLIDISALVSDADNDPIKLTRVMAAINPVQIEAPLLIKYRFSDLLESDRFTYVVEDGKGGIAQNIIEINIVNTAPIAKAVALSIDPFDVNTPSLIIDLSDSAYTSDPDDDNLQLTYVGKVIEPATLIQDGLTLTYQPNGASQTETITYTVSDGMKSSSNIISIISASDSSLTASSVRLPAIEMDSLKVPVDLSHYVSNSTGRAISIERIFGARLGTIEFEPGSLVFTYQPDNISYGIDTFYYLVSDNEGHQVQQSVTVEVNAPAKPNITDLTLEYAGPITATMTCVDCEHPTKTDYQFEVAGLPISTPANIFNPAIHQVEQNVGVLVTAKNRYCTANNQGIGGGNACQFSQAKVVIKADYLERVYSNFHAFAALKTDGTVVSWGSRDFGGDSSSADAVLFDVKELTATSSAFAALKADRTVVSWGAYWEGGNSTPVAEQLKNVERVIGNEFAFAAIRLDGSVVVWGDARYGGDATSVANELYDIQDVYGTGLAFSALRKDGKVLAWGLDIRGGDTSKVDSELYNIRRIYSNPYSFAALRKDRTVVAWGGENDGGVIESTVKPKLVKVEDITSNLRAYAALKDDGTVVAWGFNSFGGDDSIADSLQNVVQIYANVESFVALRSDGTAIAWGGALNGGDSSGVTDQLVNIDTIFSTNNAYAALRKDGTVVTWGNQVEGGNSEAVKDKLINVKAIYSTHKAFAALKEDGSVITWGDTASGGSVSEEVAAKLTDVRSIYSTGSAFIALKGNGDMVTWGDPINGGDSTGAQAKMLSETVLYKNLNLN